MLQKHPLYQTCKDHLTSSICHAGAASATFFIGKNNKTLVCESNMGCHFYFNPNKHNLDKDGIIGTGFHTVENKITESQAFKDWICSDKSPWKAITHQDDIEFIQDEKGNFKGVILGSEVINSVHPYFIKNFAIMCRFLNERATTLNTWFYLIDQKNLDPRDAYFLCRFRVKNNKTQEWMRTGHHHDGSHWPLTHPNFKRYWNGEVGVTSTSLNGFFIDKKSHPDFTSKFISDTDSYSIRDLDPFINDYFSWKERNGLPG